MIVPDKSPIETIDVSLSLICMPYHSRRVAVCLACLSWWYILSSLLEIHLLMEPTLWLSSFLRGSESARSQQQSVSWRKLLACFFLPKIELWGFLRLVMFVIPFPSTSSSWKRLFSVGFYQLIPEWKWSWAYYQSYSKVGYDTFGYLHPENKRTWSLWLVQSSNLQVDVDCLFNTWCGISEKNGNPEFCHSIK